MAQPTEPVEARVLSQIHPGRGLGWMNLGASLYSVLSKLKAQPQLYPSIDFSYSSEQPITGPIVISLPANGVRIRFDGPDQRLRLIEIVDFASSTFIYKNIEVVRRTSVDESSIAGPSFRHVYNRLFGPAYAGEYIPPDLGQSNGTYILSYPGLAIRFSLKHKSWSEKADFVSLLTAAASPAISIAIFSGSSWPGVRNTLYTRPVSLPRAPGPAIRAIDAVPDEIRCFRLHSGGKVEVVRQASYSFIIQLGETSPQEIVAELGPPDAIFRKNTSRLSIHAANRNSAPTSLLDSNPSRRDRSSSQSFSDKKDESDEESDNNDFEAEGMFYNYYHYGFDVLIAHANSRSPTFPGSNTDDVTPRDGLTITKMFLHGNIPGSYSFNRHRRSRWAVQLPLSEGELNSEMHFADISRSLKDVWKGHYCSTSEQESFERGMVLNRGWGESPESSIELLGEMDDSTIVPRAMQRSNGMMKDVVSSNTQLFGFPGMLFEVITGDFVSCVTIY